MSGTEDNQQPSDEQNELDAKLSFTVASVWRAERISCPHPHVLQSFLQGSLDGGARDFVEFHLQDSECPYCNATVDDLKARDDEAKQPVLTDMKDRLLRSTVAELGKSKG